MSLFCFFSPFFFKVNFTCPPFSPLLHSGMLVEAKGKHGKDVNSYVMALEELVMKMSHDKVEMTDVIMLLAERVQDGG